MNYLKKVFLSTLLLSLMPCQQSLKADEAHSNMQIHGFYHSGAIKIMPPQNVNYHYFNDLSMAFLKPSDDGKGTLVYSTKFPHQEFVTLAHKNKVKVLATLGGIGKKLEDDAARQHFINETISFIKKYNYDGVDIDWEFPGNYGTAVKPLIVDLTTKLHQGLTQWRKDAIVALTVGATIDRGQYFDVEKLSPCVDYWYVMTYDFHGPWSHYSGYNSQLFPSTTNSRDSDVLSMQGSLKYWLSRGIPKEKIFMGIPLYGRAYAANGWNEKLRDKENRWLDYRAILPLLDAGWEKHWDDEAKHPWLKSPGNDPFWGHDYPVILDYEDPASVRAEVGWSQKEGIGGIFFWEISEDYIPVSGFSDKGENYLVREAWKEVNKK